MKKFLLVISVAAALSACASNTSTVSKDAQLTQNWSNDQLYSEARQELNDGNYTRATALYELLRARQVDGRYTEQSLIESAYAHFKNEEPAKALQNLARFEQNYPASVDMDYALYLKGLVLFAEDQSFLRRLASQDWSDRDPEANRRAFRVFEQLVNRYPNSKYAEDARKRMAQLVDALGGHEIAIARYYAKRTAYLAANNRAQRILEQFQNTRYVEEALAIMVYTYEQMGNADMAEATRRVLAQNLPNSPYLQQAWKPDEMPWWRWWK
ncbi:outer membrane protein assembly factor BamD [Kingella kingae]|uniref:outer membrane protein assembly factor BamD n=1 Tax=Kingella kingae TaxID=504 RepID=UPI0004190E3D|nr:outer membrane protein assembly factor BamD [Kingella kingae]MDK4543948.1 outer membrane protein assembly factor BamD [Kingella kingae]MDK4565770.1 outer membrane protein assembly factor BamD [Kingella kingae]MDK4590159.1 outer membrane protein assembly factor BamD [Kingella kingae]MDK4627639.1 outer membrane protein assembly factor BamD [Kingella kingae]MDK4636217.1 outer membrane protein assembly factor BamD [Kingella kingae]